MRAKRSHPASSGARDRPACPPAAPPIPTFCERPPSSAAPLQCTQADPARHLTPDATAAIASSGTVRNARSARSATSCGAQARAPRMRFASLSAEAIFRLAIATTFTPARAKLDASPEPTRPAPMKPSVNFFGGICYELYESAGAVARGRQLQIIWDIGSTPAAGSRLSGTCPQEWTSTLSEVPNEKADRSADARRIRRHDFQRRSAGARHASDTRAIGDPGDARQSGEQEDRQVRRQEEGQR